MIMGRVKFKTLSEVQQKCSATPSQNLTNRNPSAVTLAPGASEALLRLSLRKSFTQDQIDVGYPRSYANEVFKAARSQQDGETVADITKYLLSLDEEREEISRLLLPLPNIILTILHCSLPFFIFLQFLTFLVIFVLMQGDDYWLRGWVIRDVSLERGWINRSESEQAAVTRLVPIMQEHAHLRGHLWYAWDLMILIYIPLAIAHAIFVLDGKAEEPLISEPSVTRRGEEALSYKPTHGDVIPDMEELTKGVQIGEKPEVSKGNINNSKEEEERGTGRGRGRGDVDETRVKRQNLLHRYKVKRPYQALTLLLLVVAITLLSYSSYVISCYLTYYLMESGWRDLIASWISSTMREYYTNYPNATESVPTDLLQRLNSLDEMHMILGCCGSMGYEDWRNVTKDIPLDELRYLAYPPAQNTTASVVPYSCCKWMGQSLDDICDHTSGDTNSIHTEGCTERLVQLIVYKWLRVHFWLLIAANFLMTPQVLLYLSAFQPLAFAEQIRSIGKAVRAQKELAMRVTQWKKKKDLKAAQEGTEGIRSSSHQNRG